MYRTGPGSPRERFLDQFEMDGRDWLYRYRMTGPAYRITDDEKDGLVAAFDQTERRWAWLAILPFLIYLACAAMVFMVPGVEAWANRSLSDGYTRNHGMMLLAAWFAFRWIGHWRALRVPLRALSTCAPVAPAWPRDARRRLVLAQLPLTVVVGTATIAFLLLLFFAVERPAMSPIGWIVMVASIVALPWAIVQGARKYRLDRTDHAASNFT